jgi:hypothetical protein
MSSEDWTPAIGIRRLAVSLTWRAGITVALWWLSLWLFFAALDGLEIESVPMIISVGFSVVAGTIAGFVMSRGISETAGFAGPIVALMATGFAAIAIVGGEFLFWSFMPIATEHLRFIIVVATMLVTVGWIIKHGALDI